MSAVGGEIAVYTHLLKYRSEIGGTPVLLNSLSLPLVHHYLLYFCKFSNRFSFLNIRYLVQLPSSAASATNTAASNTATTAPPPPPPLALKPENLVLCTDGGSEGGGSNYRSALAISEARLYGDQHEVVRLRFRRSPFGACDHMVRVFE